MKRKLIKILSFSFAFILLFVAFASSAAAFHFQNDVGLPSVPYVTQNYGTVVNGENIFDYPIAYVQSPYRYSTDSSNTFQRFSANYRNYWQRSTAAGIEFISDTQVYDEPADFLITTIDLGYADTVEALYSISVDSNTYYRNSDDTQYVSTSSAGGWIYFVFADTFGAITNLRITLDNGAFNDTFYLSSLIDTIASNYDDFGDYKFLLQVQIKQNIFRGVNVPAYTPIKLFESTITIGRTYLEQFKDAYFNIVQDAISDSYLFGFDDGFNNGYSDGYDEGYKDGFAMGEEVEDDGFYGWLIDALDAFLNTPLFYVYDTKVSLGGICGIFVGISVILWVLKLIAGG